MIERHQTQWHGLEDWVLESEAIQMIVVPTLGAKIVSLLDKRAGYEWLVGPMRPPKPVPYAATFIDQDMSGWDEMFPTINACNYPAAGPYHGRPLPDHGEVWTLPWQLEPSGPDALRLSVTGHVIPYRLERTLSFAGPGQIRLAYEVENTGLAPLCFLWAAHPQFVADADTAIILPGSTTEVVNVVDGAAWGAEGQRYPWPQAVTPDGRHCSLDRIGPTTLGDCRKFYLPPAEPIAWAQVTNHRLGCSLRLAWQPEQVSYLGIWVDEGCYNTAPTVALEPSNGYYDSLTLAYHNQRVATCEPGARQIWELIATLTSA